MRRWRGGIVRTGCWGSWWDNGGKERNVPIKKRPILSFLYLSLIVLMLTTNSAIGYTGIDLDVGGFAISKFHGHSAGSYLGGSYGYVVVAVNSSDFDTKSVGSFDGKPDWLDLEFGYGNMGTEFTPSDDVTSLFSPVYFVDHALPDAQKTSNFFFAVYLPHDLQDTLYCVRARVDPPPYGPIQGDSKRYSKYYECFRVISPSSDADYDRVLVSQADILFRMGEYKSIVEFADSLERVGRYVESVLGTAITASKLLERYDRALDYLDTRHETFGEKRRGHMSDVPPFEFLPYETQEQADARYQKQRQELLDKIGGKSGE